MDWHFALSVGSSSLLAVWGIIDIIGHVRARLRDEPGHGLRDGAFLLMLAGLDLSGFLVGRHEEALERAARVRIEERLAPRHVSATMHERAVGMLRAKPAENVSVVRLGDKEAGDFADDIVRMLRDAGWTVTIVDVGILSPPPYGIRYLPPQTDSERALIDALEKLPGGAVETPPEQHKEGAIIVGLKPPID